MGFAVIAALCLFPAIFMERSTEMFVAVVEAVARLGDKVVTDPDIDVILVNRFYLRGVQQVDNGAVEADDLERIQNANYRRHQAERGGRDRC